MPNTRSRSHGSAWLSRGVWIWGAMLDRLYVGVLFRVPSDLLDFDCRQADDVRHKRNWQVDGEQEIHWRGN